MKIRTLFILSALILIVSCKKESVTILTSPSASERLLFGAEHLKNSLAELKYKVVIREGGSTDLSGNNERIIWILEKEDPLASGVIDGLGFSLPEEMDNEGYYIATENNRTLVYGEDPSGALYGCYTLSDLFNEKQPLPLSWWTLLKWFYAGPVSACRNLITCRKEPCMNILIHRRHFLVLR